MRYENCAGTISKFLFSGFGGAGVFFYWGKIIDISTCGGFFVKNYRNFAKNWRNFTENDSWANCAVTYRTVGDIP
jgi:hypothetical protein